MAAHTYIGRKLTKEEQAEKDLIANRMNDSAAATRAADQLGRWRYRQAVIRQRLKRG